MTNIHFNIFCFCFAEELASFWSVFKKRMYSDPELIITLVHLFHLNIISLDQLELLVHLSQEQFQYHLIIHLVKASVAIGVHNITSFTTFLLHNHHYTTLHKQWKELGKKISLLQIILNMKQKILYYKMCIAHLSWTLKCLIVIVYFSFMGIYFSIGHTHWHSLKLQQPTNLPMYQESTGYSTLSVLNVSTLFEVNMCVH